MHVRLLRHWAGFRPQRVFSAMPDGVANALIRRRLAEPIEQDGAARSPVSPRPELAGLGEPRLREEEYAAEAQDAPVRGTGLQDAGPAPGRRATKRRSERVRG